MRKYKHHILYIVIATILSGLISINNGSNVSALSYQSSVGVGFTFLPTLNVSLSSDNLTINNLVPGGNAEDSNTITINVSTNIAEGYNLMATVGSSNDGSSNNSNTNTNANTATNAATSNGYNTTNLVNVVDNDYTFTPLSSNVSELSNFTNNTWGYSYSLDSGTTWISGDYDNASTGYNGLPLYTNTGVKLVEEADNTSSTVDFKIAAKASNTQPSGEYTNVINFTVVSNTIPTTMLDAFIASGAQMYKGYFKMQDMTPTICKSIDTDGEKGMQLIDIRDDKIYWVAKLADDNCWMTQNLDLDIVAGSTSLTSNNTDLSADESVYTVDNTIYALKGAGDTYGYTYENSIATWIPERTTIAYNQLNSTNWQNSNTDPYSWDRLKTSGANADHGLSGNYYNWTASLASNDSTNATGNPTNSICPKGWRLPNATNKEFGNLLVQYNIISTNTSTSYIDGVSSVNSMGAAPLYFVRGGFVSGGSLSSSGNNGYYWSSTFYNGSYAYLLRYNSSIVKPQYDDGRYYGWPVRCLARSN